MTNLFAYNSPIKIDRENGQIAVTQFNILAGNLATQKHFPYVLENYLDWSIRKYKIVENIQKIFQNDLPDFICCEELNDYWTFFKYEFDKLGYDSIFLQRQSTHESSWSGRDKKDGCGIFWLKKYWKLEEQIPINYTDIHDRIAFMGVFTSLVLKKTIIVGNTHLYWDSKKIEIQLDEVKDFSQYFIKTRKSFQNCPAIITGDFNNGPSSQIYEFMTNKFGKDENNEKVCLRSAYDFYQKFNRDLKKEISPNDVKYGADLEPSFTTVNWKRSWTIDYIFYTQEKLSIKKILKLPSTNDLNCDNGPEDWWKNIDLSISFRKSIQELDFSKNSKYANGIPNSTFGSDHLPICAIFQLI